jgi:hypothetical protein
MAVRHYYVSTLTGPKGLVERLSWALQPACSMQTRSIFVHRQLPRFQWLPDKRTFWIDLRCPLCLTSVLEPHHDVGIGEGFRWAEVDRRQTDRRTRSFAVAAPVVGPTNANLARLRALTSRDFTG